MLKWNSVCVCVCVCVAGLWCVCTQSRPTLCGPTLSCQVLCPRDFPGKNSGVGLHFLLQGIFLILRLNPRLLRLLKGQASSLPPMPPGKPQNDVGCDINHSIPWNETIILVTCCCITTLKSKGLKIIIVIFLLSLRVLRVDDAARQFSLRYLPPELRLGSAGVSLRHVAGAWQETQRLVGWNTRDTVCISLWLSVVSPAGRPQSRGTSSMLIQAPECILETVLQESVQGFLRASGIMQHHSGILCWSKPPPQSSRFRGGASDSTSWWGSGKSFKSMWDGNVVASILGKHNLPRPLLMFCWLSSLATGCF